MLNTNTVYDNKHSSLKCDTPSIVQEILNHLPCSLQGLGLHGLDLHGLDLHGLGLHGLDLHGLGLHGLGLHGLGLHGLDLNGVGLHGLGLYDLDPHHLCCFHRLAADFPLQDELLSDPREEKEILSILMKYPAANYNVCYNNPFLPGAWPLK